MAKSKASSNDTPIERMPIWGDRSLLEQLEERALLDDRDLSWLTREIYQNPDRLSAMTHIRLPPSTNTSGLQPTSQSPGSPEEPA